MKTAHVPKPDMVKSLDGQEGEKQIRGVSSVSWISFLAPGQKDKVYSGTCKDLSYELIPLNGRHKLVIVNTHKKKSLWSSDTMEREINVMNRLCDLRRGIASCKLF